MTGATIRPLAAADLPSVAALWNATYAATHPLPTGGAAGLGRLGTWWASPDTEPGLTFGAEHHGRLVGALLARLPRRSWAPPDLAHVSLLAVAPDAQRRGVGSALWRHAVDALRARGATRLRLGADPVHLLPGVPASAPADAWRFFAGRGAAFGAVEADLHVDLRRGPPTAPCPAELVVDDPDAVAAFVARAFPGRWADEAATFARSGCHLLGLAHDAQIVAFAAAFEPEDRFVGASLTWAAALPGRPGGLGPLGVDASRRGVGLGLGIVAAAARWHHERGAQDLIIDWTTLAPFYGRVGARLWRAYQRAELAIDGPSS